MEIKNRISPEGRDWERPDGIRYEWGQTGWGRLGKTHRDGVEREAI